MRWDTLKGSGVSNNSKMKLFSRADHSPFMKQIYQKTIADVLHEFNTNPDQGLTSHRAQEKLNQIGFNELPEEKPTPLIIIFFKQFANPLIYILLIAALLIFFISDSQFDAFLISGILLFNAILGTIQESRTQKVLLRLKEFTIAQSIVIRDGKKNLLENRFIVPGDIILLQSGQKVPADARLLEAHQLLIDEAMLTGESEPIAKKVDNGIASAVNLAQQTNMIFSGTTILVGRAKAVVVATGLQTAIGQISQSIAQISTDVPLVKQMRVFSWVIILLVASLCIVLFFIGALAGFATKEIVVLLIALFICVIPEGLPVVLTLILVTGVYRMAKRQVLVKNMQAVEGLGHVHSIIMDKTGTITRNEMLVTHFFYEDNVYTVSGKGYFGQGKVFFEGKEVKGTHEKFRLLGQALGLLNTATITYLKKKGTFAITGDPTEAALFVFAQKLGIKIAQLEKEFQMIYEIPFESELRYHAGFYGHNNDIIAFITGSPEIIFMRSDVSQKAKETLASFVQQGLRVIAIAYKRLDQSEIPEVHDRQKHAAFNALLANDLEFLGLCGIEDSIRPEAASTISNARRAGLHIIMATGDHQRTALAIAKQVGIYKEEDEAIDGSELDTISDEELKNLIINTTVFSRVTPLQKLRIIKALHAHEFLVAMIGDGVNDAPSLVAADIGMGMGGIGSEVAKEASDIILLDDSFVNVVHAIEEGRHILYTLRRVILYFFSTNLAEVLIILLTFIFSIFFKTSLLFPLTAAQILLINLVTDGFLDSALAMEKKEKKILLQSSWLQEKYTNIIDKHTMAKVLFAAIIMAIGSFFIFLLYAPINMLLARTMTLMTLSMYQWFNAWNCRSQTKSTFQLGLFSNLWLVAATILVVLIQAAVLYIPFLSEIFDTIPINSFQWGLVIIVSSSILWFEEMRKWIASWHN